LGPIDDYSNNRHSSYGASAQGIFNIRWSKSDHFLGGDGDKPVWEKKGCAQCKMKFVCKMSAAK